MGTYYKRNIEEEYWSLSERELITGDYHIGPG